MPEQITLSEPLHHFKGLISNLDRQFAGLICQLAGEKASEELYLAAALASHLTLTGKQVCFDMAKARERQSIIDFFQNLFQGNQQTDLEWIDILNAVPIPKNWPQRILDSQMVADISRDKNRYKPLVLDKGKLYLHRYWQYEQDLSNSLRQKLQQNRLGKNDPYNLNPELTKKEIISTSTLFKDQDPDNISTKQQIMAVFTALKSYLTVITGGPGTGKTTIVSLILAILLLYKPDLRIALCAPTGKAQTRLKESIIEEQSALICPDQVKQRLLSLRPSTIHRLLGSKPDSVFFRHHSGHPLNIDLLIVDEVSMVSLPLMAKLMAAVPTSAGVILLGDKDQLASVESGSILADICDSFSSLQRSNIIETQNLQYQDLQAKDRFQSPPSIIVELKTSFRFKENGGIGKLKRFVELGLEKEALALLKSDKSGELVYRPLPSPKDLPAGLNNFVFNWSIATEDESIFFSDCLKYPSQCSTEKVNLSVARAYEHFSRFRILCAFRRGPYGVEYINHLLRRIMGKTASYCHGLPIMVTSNESVLNLYNGDIGLCWQDNDQALKVFFPSIDNQKQGGTPQFRTFLPSQLPNHEPVFAMTVHKAQGSGFDNLLLILPDYDSPILTRELIYTGLTRAKKKITLWTTEEILSSAISRTTLRASGLKDNLIREVE